MVAQKSILEEFAADTFSSFQWHMRSCSSESYPFILNNEIMNTVKKVLLFFTEVLEHSFFF